MGSAGSTRRATGLCHLPKLGDVHHRWILRYGPEGLGCFRGVARSHVSDTEQQPRVIRILYSALADASLQCLDGLGIVAIAEVSRAEFDVRFTGGLGACGGVLLVERRLVERDRLLGICRDTCRMFLVAIRREDALLRALVE